MNSSMEHRLQKLEQKVESLENEIQELKREKYSPRNGAHDFVVKNEEMDEWSNYGLSSTSMQSSCDYKNDIDDLEEKNQNQKQSSSNRSKSPIRIRFKTLKGQSAINLHPPVISFPSVSSEVLNKEALSEFSMQGMKEVRLSKAGRKRKIPANSSYVEYNQRDIERFITLISDSPSIWNPSNALYYRNDVKSRCFKNIEDDCTFLKQDSTKGSTAKRLWTELVSEYGKENRRHNGISGSSDGQVLFEHFFLMNSFLCLRGKVIEENSIPEITGFGDLEEYPVDHTPLKTRNKDEDDFAPVLEAIGSAAASAMNNIQSTVSSSSAPPPMPATPRNYDDIFGALSRSLDRVPEKDLFLVKMRIFSAVQKEIDNYLHPTGQ